MAEYAEHKPFGGVGIEARLRSTVLRSTLRCMDAVRIETNVDERGEVHLTNLPFPAGEPVEVTVVSQVAHHPGGGFPLRGVPIVYKRPTDPVATEDWDALR